MVNGIKVTSTTFLQEVANKNIANASIWNKLGYNGVVSTTTEFLTAVGTTFSPIASESQLEIVSDSANDTIAWTGAQKVTIYYLDSDYIEHTEEVELDGITPVLTTATDIFRINGFKVSQVGTTLYAEGNIDLRDTTDTPIYSRIEAGYNSARDFFYTVPANKTLYITDIMYSAGATVSGRNCRFTLIADYDIESNTSLVSKGLFMSVCELSLQDQTIQSILDIPIRLPEKTTVLIRVLGDGSLIASAKASGYII